MTTGSTVSSQSSPIPPPPGGPWGGARIPNPRRRLWTHPAGLAEFDDYSWTPLLARVPKTVPSPQLASLQHMGAVSPDQHPHILSLGKSHINCKVSSTANTPYVTLKWPNQPWSLSTSLANPSISDKSQQRMKWDWITIWLYLQNKSNYNLLLLCFWICYLLCIIMLANKFSYILLCVAVCGCKCPPLSRSSKIFLMTWKCKIRVFRLVLAWNVLWIFLVLTLFIYVRLHCNKSW